MNVKPILFSGPMVRALIESRKTQTRRIIKPQPFIDQMGNFCAPDRKGKIWNWGQHTDGSPCVRDYMKKHVKFAPGDLLYVRESFSPWSNCEGLSGVDYMATTRQTRPWTPSIHMPREFSRLTLKVTDVKVERLQDVSEADAEAEGVTKVKDHCYVVRGFGYDESGLCHSRATIPFAQLWDSLNEERGFGWEANPWVVAVTFEVIHANVDAVLTPKPAQRMEVAI